MIYELCPLVGFPVIQQRMNDHSGLSGNRIHQCIEAAKGSSEVVAKFKAEISLYVEVH